MPARAHVRDVAIGSTITSDIPPRLDALGFTHWHRKMVLALGITWVLDGLEASLIANLAPSLQSSATLGLTGGEVGFANTVYLVGEVIGALVFGRLADQLGRKKLFMVTLVVYLIATALSGLSPTYGAFLVFRCVAGMGIGGEYSAINSAIDELVPAHLRGRIDLGINGSYWLGVGGGAGLTLILLNPAVIPVALGWRLAFGAGALLGVVILALRRDLPESPRWLLMHGYRGEAESAMAFIEQKCGVLTPNVAGVPIHVHGVVNARHLARVLLVTLRKRTVLGLSLMLAQAFLYNAIFFSYALILTTFHGVASDRVGLYVVPFAIGNFAGPLVLGHLFDKLGRRVMIPATYALSAILLMATGLLFLGGYLDALTQTIAWAVVFFFASAAASSAYLTVSELFPVELRGMAIALFFAFGTLVGSLAPTVFGRIVDSGKPVELVIGYAIASALMLGAAVIARVFGVDAEGKSLEDLADRS